MVHRHVTDEQEHLAIRDERVACRLRDDGLSRRDLLKLGVAGSLLLSGGSLAFAPGAVAQTTAPGGILKPLPARWFTRLGTNAEMRWDAMRGEGYVTDAERFFVRNHTATPIIDAATWRLEVFGSGVTTPLSLRYRDLLRMPSATLFSAIECAGNGRRLYGSQQGTPAAGSQWGLGAIGVAEWRGVPLREVLERAGITPGAVDVMPAGLDPTVVAGGVDQGHVRRPLPVGKALDDALLAYEMNGRRLPRDHGFPVRLVVPGWVGIASIKWVGSIEVSEEPLFSYWNTTQYRLSPEAAPLTTQPVKSAFELPWPATARAGRKVVLRGRSWSGEAPIRRVEIRIEGPAGGGPPVEATFNGPNRPHAWVRWSIPWTPQVAGEHQLLARATDAAGTTQPDTVPFNANGYQFWAVARHPATVA